MGKLNYTHRRMGGAKLGLVVKKDLVKQCKASPKAKGPKETSLEINLQGKELGDEGLKYCCEGLVEALSTGSVKLIELNLAKNDITFFGLKFLCPVIRFAVHDLRDLDLRSNALSLKTVADQESWEQFLRSFRNVFGLRRLDVSKNNIGNRGFEILWRCYAQEDPIASPLSTLQLSGDNFDDGDGYVSDESDERSTSISSESSGSRVSLMTPIRRTPNRIRGESALAIGDGLPKLSLGAELRGLRSTPYIIVSDTGITDSGALFLSYIVANHPTPNSLSQHPPATRLGYSETLDAYNTDSCAGIIYTLNEATSAASRRVLECAEQVRPMVAAQNIDPKINGRRLTSGLSPIVSRSQTKLLTSPSKAHIPLHDLDKARCKVEGAILKETGATSVQLWQNALKLLPLCRLFLIEPETSRQKLGDVGCKDRASAETVPRDLQSDAEARSSIQSAAVSPSQRLPETLWVRILRQAADPQLLLSQRQVNRVVEWAKRRDTLEKERESLGKHPSQQLWRVLEVVGCLAYEGL